MPPWLPAAACSFPRCPGRCAPGARFCPQHSTVKARKGFAPPRSSNKAGYDYTWQRLRKMHLNSNPMCIECAKVGIVEPATDVDHRIPISVRPDLRLDMANLDSLCHSHHSQKTRREQSNVRD